MNCIECEQLLQQQLDGEAMADRTALDVHLASCACCRARHAAAQRLVDSLRLLPVPVPPEGMSAAIVASVLEQQRAGRRSRRRVLSAAALAASIIVMAFTIAFWPRAGGPSSV